MKKFFTLIIVTLVSLSTYAQDLIPIEFLVDAMIHVESRGDSTAIGDGS